MKPRKIRLTLKDRWNIFKMENLISKLRSVIQKPDNPHRKHKRRQELQIQINTLRREYFRPRAKSVAEKFGIPHRVPNINSFIYFRWMIKYQHKIRDPKFKFEGPKSLRDTILRS